MAQVIGARIRALREERGLSQSHLAVRSGLTRSQIGRVEKDQRPGVQAVAVGRLAAALHTTSDYLLGLTADPTPPPLADWRTDPAHLVRLRRLVERIVRLPRDQQDRVMDAVLTLLEVSDAANGQGIAMESRPGALP
jgi:transcriptional regulator with XRE-family HTH domain